MNYKKMFFPICDGDELEEKLYGALLIAKHFNVSLGILKCTTNYYKDMYKDVDMPQNLVHEIDEVVNTRLNEDNIKFDTVIKRIAATIDIDISEHFLANKAHVIVNKKDGYKVSLVEQESKFCDIVITSTPPHGISTTSFETSVLKSGKSVLMFPHVMRHFDTKSIIIGWNNSTEASRAITSSIELLKEAEKVHIVSSKEYVDNLETMDQLISYLKCHDIDATYELVQTTRIPGQALLNAALDGNFDLIVAGAYGHQGLKELMFGGATRYLLENSTLPVFMSH